MITIREGQIGDAERLAQMMIAFNVEEGSPGRIARSGVVELCFDDGYLYKPLVAETEGRLVGYALVMRYYDTEPCAWCSYMQDLYVEPDWRSRGVGRRLVARAARLTVDERRLELLWHVRDHNRRGRAFYSRVGGKEQTPLPVTLSGDALRQLADEADQPAP